MFYQLHEMDAPEYKKVISTKATKLGGEKKLN